MTHNVVHILVSVNIPLLATQGFGGIYWKGFGKSGVVGDAAWIAVTSPLKEPLRLRMLLNILPFYFQYGWHDNPRKTLILPLIRFLRNPSQTPTYNREYALSSTDINKGVNLYPERGLRSSVPLDPYLVSFKTINLKHIIIHGKNVKGKNDKNNKGYPPHD